MTTAHEVAAITARAYVQGQSATAALTEAGIGTVRVQDGTEAIAFALADLSADDEGYVACPTCSTRVRVGGKRSGLHLAHDEDATREILTATVARVAAAMGADSATIRRATEYLRSRRYVVEHVTVGCYYCND